MKKLNIILSVIFTAFVCLLIGAATRTVYPEIGNVVCIVAAVLFAGAILVAVTMPQRDVAFLLCGTMTRGAKPNCAVPLSEGLEIRTLITNKNDIASYTTLAGNRLVVTAIVMKTVHTIVYGTLVGNFVEGEVVRDTTSSAKGVVRVDNGTDTFVLGETTGAFTAADVLVGDISGATAVVTTDTSSTAKWFEWEGIKTSNEAKTTLIKDKYVSSHDHETDQVVFNVDPDTKQELDKSKGGVFVQIVEYKYKGVGGNAAFEIFGLDQGLETAKLERDSTSKDTKAGYLWQLKTLAGYSEPHLPRTFYDTDYATTLAAVNALI